MNNNYVYWSIFLMLWEGKFEVSFPPAPLFVYSQGLSFLKFHCAMIDVLALWYNGSVCALYSWGFACTCQWYSSSLILLTTLGCLVLFNENLESRKDECCHCGCLDTYSICVVRLSLSVFLENHIMLPNWKE